MSAPRAVVGLRSMLAIALPMIVSQASETVMLFFNRYFVSFLGAEYIPASMSGGLSQFVFTSLFTGVVGYVNALSAQHYGAGRPEKSVLVASQGFWLSLAFYPLLLGLIPLVGKGFVWAGHTSRQVDLEFTFFRILMLGSPLFLLQSVLAGFFVGTGRTRVVMVANLVGILFNLPLNAVLVLGKFGIPSLGMAGAALGTLGGTLAIVTVLAVSYLRCPLYVQFGGRRAWRLDRDLAGKLLRFGGPAGLELFINVFAFNAFLQLMHSYGPVVATAVTITFNYDLVAFIPMLGVGHAVTAIVGQRMGAGDPAGAKRVAYLGMKVAWGYAGIMMLVFVTLAPRLAAFFLHEPAGSAQTILALAIPMLRLAALYTLADATQVVFSGALRGAGDTTWVMIVSGLLHWAMAMGSFLFIRVLVLPPLIVWLFFIVFVVSLGAAMFLRHGGGAWQAIRLVGSAEQPRPPRRVQEKPDDERSGEHGITSLAESTAPKAPRERRSP